MSTDDRLPVDLESTLFQENARQLFNRFIPDKLMALLTKGKVSQLKPGDHVEQRMTILFSDIRNFTTISESMRPEDNFAFINAYFSAVAPAITAHGGMIDKYIGDAVMAVFVDSVDDAIAGSLDMLKNLRQFNQIYAAVGDPIRIGIGLNSGIAMLGMIGNEERMDSTVIGDVVNTASRLESLTKTYGIDLLIGEDTYYAIQDPNRFHIRFIDRIHVKGKSRPQSVYEVYDGSPAQLDLTLKLQPQFEHAVASYHMGMIDQANDLFQQCLTINPQDTIVQLYLTRCKTFQETGQHDTTGELAGDVAWRDEYSIGVEEVDNQHKTLLDAINRIAASIKRGDTEETAETMTFLGNYAIRHFEDEERVMRQHDYPLLPGHIEEHQRFVKAYVRFNQEIAKGELDSSLFLFKVDLFLVDWLISHTVKQDGHFGRYLRKKQATA